MPARRPLSNDLKHLIVSKYISGLKQILITAIKFEVLRTIWASKTRGTVATLPKSGRLLPWKEDVQVNTNKKY